MFRNARSVNGTVQTFIWLKASQQIEQFEQTLNFCYNVNWVAKNLQCKVVAILEKFLVN